MRVRVSVRARLTDAIPDPGTVMVEACDATVADSAVFGA